MAHPTPRPNAVLLDLLAALLAPLFLEVTGYDYAVARAAALETIMGYRASTGADLLLVAQVIAFSLGSVSTMMQSLADDLSPQTASRMQATANALGRTADRARAMLEKTRPEAQPHPAEQQAPVTAAAGDVFADSPAVPSHADPATAEAPPATAPATLQADLPAPQRHAMIAPPTPDAVAAVLAGPDAPAQTWRSHPCAAADRIPAPA